MILRVLCLATGVMVMFVPAIVMPTGALATSAGKAVAALTCLVLSAFAFLLVGMAAHLLRRSPGLRTLAALLLAVPLASCAVLLWRDVTPALSWIAGAMLGFTLTLYVTLVYPVLRGQWQRPRQRGLALARRVVSQTSG